MTFRNGVQGQMLRRPSWWVGHASLRLNLFLIQCSTVPRQPFPTLKCTTTADTMASSLQEMIPMQICTCAAACVVAFGLLCRRYILPTLRNPTSAIVPSISYTPQSTGTWSSALARGRESGTAASWKVRELRAYLNDRNFLTNAHDDGARVSNTNTF
jgi:hypothetical protein